MTYLELLKILLPQGVYTDDNGSLHEKDLSVQAVPFDTCQGNADALLEEIFPDTTNALLEDWERVYDLKQSDKTLTQRIQGLLAAINARGGLSRAQIQATLRPFLGYDPTITEYMVFRCDDPRCLTDDKLFAFDGEYTTLFKVFVDAGADLAAIQAVLNKIKPAHTSGIVEVA